jgi:orf78
MDNFINNCLNAVWLTLSVEDNQVDEIYESLKIVWFSKTLQNHKALIMSTHDDLNHLYWEVTYNGNRNEYYVDRYRKASNVVISGEDVEDM